MNKPFKMCQSCNYPGERCRDCPMENEEEEEKEKDEDQAMKIELEISKENELVRPDEIDAVAFEGPRTPDRGYTIRASYLKAPRNGDALIEVMKDGQSVRRFLFPAYKIYNLQAHFRDIVDGEIAKSARGYEMAAWDGCSANQSKGETV